MSVEDNDLKPGHNNHGVKTTTTNNRDSRKATHIEKSKSFNSVDFGFTRQPATTLTNIAQSPCFDSVDLGFSRQPGSILKAEKADLLDCFIAVISIFTFLADVGTDILAAHQYSSKSQWTWFIPTVTLIVLPSIVLQLFSSRWYHDDLKTQSIFSYVIHFLQLSTIERYMKAFWYGTKTLVTSKPKQSDFSLYLESWRDVTLLRLFECFLESAPQVVLQLYILSKLGRRITISEDWVTITAVTLSIGSIGWSMVSYSHALRLCNKRRGFSFCGYTFQVIYRLSMISSRIAALTLFTTEFGWFVILVVFIHWFFMIVWLTWEGTEFCSHPNHLCKLSLERLFAIVMGIVYVFCFINIKEGTTRFRIMIYYLIFFVENSLLVAVWYPTRSQVGILEIGSIVFTWGGFLVGILSMLAYYKFFHPKQDITEGWCNCCTKENSEEESSMSIEDENNDLSHPNDLRGEGMDVVHPVHPEKRTPQMNRSLSVEVELSPSRISPSLSRKAAVSPRETLFHSKGVMYGSTQESPAVRHKEENEAEFLVATINGDDVRYKVVVQRSTPTYDSSGTASKFFV